MTREEYAKLAATYALFLLRQRPTIDSASADACNLYALLQEGLGDSDNDPQVPLDEIVKYVHNQMKMS